MVKRINEITKNFKLRFTFTSYVKKFVASLIRFIRQLFAEGYFLRERAARRLRASVKEAKVSIKSERVMEAFCTIC